MFKTILSFFQHIWHIWHYNPYSVYWATFNTFDIAFDLCISVSILFVQLYTH